MALKFVVHTMTLSDMQKLSWHGAPCSSYCIVHRFNPFSNPRINYEEMSHSHHFRRVARPDGYSSWLISALLTIGYQQLAHSTIVVAGT